MAVKARSGSMAKKVSGSKAAPGRPLERACTNTQSLGMKPTEEPKENNPNECDQDGYMCGHCKRENHLAGSVTSCADGPVPEFTASGCSTRRRITAAFEICFWPEVRLKDQDNNSGRIPIDQGDRHANHPAPRCSGSERRPTLARAKAADPERVSRQPDTSGQPAGEKFTLSPAEHRMVELIVAGYTNEDMARRFSRSRNTIYRRIVVILGKLGVANKLELALFAINHRIVAGARTEHRE
jgi:DNA-binding CsgD family transcriptional regulator